MAFIDLLACLALALAFGRMVLAFGRLPLSKDAKYILAGFLILLLSYHLVLFMEWFWGATQTRLSFDRIEDFIGALEPMAWLLMIYAVVKVVTTREARKNEETLRAFLDHHFQFTFMLDPEGRLLMANQAAMAFAGISSDEVVGKPFWHTPWWQGRPAARDALFDQFASAKTGQFARFETELENHQQVPRIFDFSIKPFWDELGRLQWVVVEGRDISDLRKAQTLAEEALTLSNTILYKVNLKTCRFEYITPYVQSVTGFSVADFLEKGVGWLKGRLHPDDRSRIEAIVGQIDPRNGAEGADLAVQLRFKGKDGAMDWYQTRLTPCYDQHGSAESVVGSVERITEQKEAEKVLRNYEQIVSHTGDMLALVDDRYVFQAVNKAYLSYAAGESVASLIGKQMAAIEGEEHFFTVTKPMADRCLKGEEVNFQTWLSLPDGRRRYLDVQYFPYIDNEHTRISGFVISARDITENRQLEAQLRQGQKMEAIGVLAGGIAHDFNNILAAIMGYAELGLSALEDRAALHTYLQKIHEAGRRAADLVRQILTFSRQTKPETSPLHLKPLVKEALKFIRASLPSTITIRQNFHSDGYVLADPTQIHQVVMNLAANAAHAMKADGGTLEVTLTDRRVSEVSASQHLDLTAGEYIVLTVSDSGAGMPKQILERIFEPFFTTKPKEEGTGMGLSVVHGIVKSCGGAISVDTQEGRGTTFDIYLPSVSSGDAGPGDDVGNEAPGGAERILFVDDEAAIVEIGRRTLERLGYTVTAASGSVEALKIFEQRCRDFDLVITDMTMPEMSGGKLAAAMLKLRPDIPIMVATGFSDEIAAGEMAALGIKTIIYKPFVRGELARAVREALAR